MRFLADECCDVALVGALRTDGHDVLYAVETLRGATDEELLNRALLEHRVLLTEDKDFGELIYRLARSGYRGAISSTSPTSLRRCSRLLMPTVIA